MPPISKENKVARVVMSKADWDEASKIAKRNCRSFSSWVAFLIRREIERSKGKEI